MRMDSSPTCQHCGVLVWECWKGFHQYWKDITGNLKCWQPQTRQPQTRPVRFHKAGIPLTQVAAELKEVEASLR